MALSRVMGVLDVSKMEVKQKNKFTAYKVTQVCHLYPKSLTRYSLKKQALSGVLTILIRNITK